MNERRRRGIPTAQRWGQAAAATTLAGALFLTAGCASHMLSPAEARAAFHRISENFSRIQRALYCDTATVSFRYRDADGRVRRFIGQPATIIFEAPRCLYFDIKSPLAGSVAHLGSNDERYWLWFDVPDERSLRWGTWEALAAGHAEELVVPPDRLLDALLLRPLPTHLPDGPHPLLIEDPDGTRRLLFQLSDGRQWPFLAREVVLDARPPYLPREIIDRDADGAVLMDAQIGAYQRISDGGADAPFIARRFVVRWDNGETELRLDLQRVRYRTRDVPFCDFPEGWRGEVIPLDLDEPASEPIDSQTEQDQP